MPDDDPIEEVRTVAMTGAAAASRVVETSVQAARRRQEDRDRVLVEEARRQATDATYDAARGERGRDFVQAGVPVEALEARLTSDLMNGQSPSLAAAQGGSKRTETRTTPRAPARQRTR